MKHLFSFFLSSFFLLAANGQNLVPNPSFEEYSECPETLGQVQNCSFWSVFGGTPDYFNLCSDNPLVSIPSTYFGYQDALSGNAYMGLYTVAPKDAREVIGSQLTENLTIGSVYNISFNAVLGYNGEGVSTCYSNNLGVRFSTIPYSESNVIPTSNWAHFTYTPIITDSINWVNVQGTFTADSAYTYVSVGNFFDNANTDTIQFQAPGKVAYYLIDDVCVSLASGDCLINSIEDSNESMYPTLYPNPATTQTQLTYHTPQGAMPTVQLTDMLGRVVHSAQLPSHEGTYTLDASILGAGVYFCTLLNGTEVLATQKLVVTAKE